MQGRIGNCHAADENGLQPRDRRKGSGAADLDIDPDDLGEFLLRRELMRDSEPGSARDETQLTLPVEPVDFVNHAVDRIGQLTAHLSNVAEIGQQSIGPRRISALDGNRKAKRGKMIEEFRMSGPGWLGRYGPIGKKPERALRGDMRVELPKASGCCIAWVDELLGAGSILALVQGLEIGAKHKHLAPHLELRRAL